MKKKALIVSIAILVVIGIFSFVNIFKVGQSFVKHTRFAEGIEDITDANLKKCVQTALTAAGEGAALADIRTLDCSNSGIVSVAGITNLTGLQTLNLSGNAIEGGIELTGMTSLTGINVSNNPKLTSLKLYSATISSYDLSDTGIQNITDVKIGDNTIQGANRNVQVLRLGGIPWDDNMKQLLLDTASTLVDISLADTGFNDATFFTSNGNQFVNLEALDLSGNDLTNISLAGVKFKKHEDETYHGRFVCDSCNISNITLDTATIKELIIPNNKIGSFYARRIDQYPALKTLDLSGNPLKYDSFDITPNGFEGVTDINLSNINFVPSLPLSTLNPSNVVRVTMRNSNLGSDLDFSTFSPKFKELDISNFATDDASHPNNVSTIKFAFTASNSAENSQIESINVSGNKSFSEITVEKLEGVENDDEPELEKLKKLDLSFTNISSFEFEDMPAINDINVVGCKELTSLSLSEEQKTQLKRIGIALSGLYTDSIPKDKAALEEIIVNTESPQILSLDSYPGLKKIIVASEKDVYGVTTADSFDTSMVLSAIPQNITGVTAYNVYEGYSADGKKVSVIPAGKNIQLFLDANNVKIEKVVDTTKEYEYNGYFEVSPIKVSSEKYKFDTLNNEKVIVVGQDETYDIVDAVIVSDDEVSKSISEDEKYLILSKGETEIARYRLLRVDPGSYTPENPDQPGGEDDPSGGGSGGNEELPDDDGGHSSLDPSAEPSGDGGSGEYETTDPTTTGAFISIVSLVVLVIAGVFSQFYMKKKRKEEELIEKI